MIYFYYGEDSYRAKQTVDQLRRKFVELYDKAGHNLETITEDEFTLEKFFTSAKSSGFLAPKKCILIKNIFSVKKFADIQDPLIEYLKTLKNSKDENYLIFWQEGVPKQNTKLFKFLIKLTEPMKCCKNFEKLSEPQFIAWMQKEAEASGKKLTKDAAELLLGMIGDNSWNMHHELQKLCHFTAHDAISTADVEELIKATQGETIFTLLDAVSAKQVPKALELLEDYLQRESDRQFLFSMLVRQFRLLVYAKEASAESSNSYAIAQRLKLHPFVAKKMLAHSHNFTHKELEHAYAGLIALDRILKSDPAKLETALTLFVSRL